MGDVGAVATLAQKILEFFTSESQLPALRKRHTLERLRKQAKDALARNDLAALRAAVDELQREATRP